MSEGKPFDFGLAGFKTFSERIRSERVDRLAMSKRILSFGVDFLDRAFGGIFPNDLLLVGAKTGKGKTALSSIIAMRNAARGKRVHYFALEAEDRELERRLKYMMLSGVVFKAARQDPTIDVRRMNYLEWYAARIDDMTARFEPQAEQMLAERLTTLHTFYRARDFNAETLEKLILAIQDQTDLVVVDHLHYIDSDDANENRGLKDIVKTIRDSALLIGKPVILVAHVRKSERRGAPVIPTLEDFMGSSDISKIATKALMIAPDETSGVSGNLLSTFMWPAKCRQDGSRTRYVARIPFNLSTSQYEDRFELGRIVNEQFEAVPLANQPEWATRVALNGGNA